MKIIFPRLLVFACAASLVSSVARAEIPVPNEPGVVSYNPVIKIAQGNQPYAETYDLTITMPANLTPGVTIPVSLLVSVMSRPAGLPEATALSYVTLNTPSLIVTQPNEIKHVSITISVPVGSAAGGYSWRVTTTGWPSSLGPITDNGHLINGLFSSPGTSDTSTPAITLTSPPEGSVYTCTPGNPVTVPVNFSASVGTSGQPISGLSAFNNGAPVSFTASGINTFSVTGAGSVQLTEGTYTISASATNLYGTSTATSNISVVLVGTPPPVCHDLTWLPPISLNKTIQGGSTMPIKFTLTCHGDFVRDTSVLIAIYEVFLNGTASNPVTYSYGNGSPNPPDYAITGNQYHLNFETAKGTHYYRIEVYSSASGYLELLGSKVLNTK